jgi:hypothetical protein
MNTSASIVSAGIVPDNSGKLELNFQYAQPIAPKITHITASKPRSNQTFQTLRLGVFFRSVVSVVDIS